jgi:hypothetical protein
MGEPDEFHPKSVQRPRRTLAWRVCALQVLWRGSYNPENADSPSVFRGVCVLKRLSLSGMRRVRGLPLTSAKLCREILSSSGSIEAGSMRELLPANKCVTVRAGSGSKGIRETEGSMIQL